jgi:hypothetical protein
MAIQNQQELNYEMALVDHKANRDGALEQYKTTEAIHLTSFKSTLDFGTHATRGMLVLNGASAIALLAFLGSSRATDWHIGMLALALGTFAAGAFFSVLGMALTYLGQSFFTLATRRRRDHSPTGYCFQGVAIVVWLAAAGFFILGLLRSARVFSADFGLSAVLGL